MITPREFGKPAQVVIEATRDMAKSAEELNNIEKTIRDNEKRNDRWRAELQEAGLLAEGARIGDRFLRMRLWEEMGRGPADRLCPYTGRPIALHLLHSDEIEIDHILPFEETFDDSPANKTLCFREANRRKSKLSPTEAADQQPDFFDLAAIIGRTKHLPANLLELQLGRNCVKRKLETPRSCRTTPIGYGCPVLRASASENSSSSNTRFCLLDPSADMWPATMDTACEMRFGSPSRRFSNRQRVCMS